MKAFVLRHAGYAAIMLAVAAASSLDAQTPPAQGSAAKTAAAPQHPRKHGRKPKAGVPEPVAQVEPPAPPPAPNWPVNSKAEHANIAWNGRDLSVQASNSSLQQILHDVSTATGLKVEGLAGGSGEQRIYGSYGPAATRDVLSALLEGSGYNVLMIGDSGEGTPRVLVLTSKARTASKAAGPQNNAQANQDNQDNQFTEEEVPEEPEQPEPQPQQNLRPPFGAQGPGARTPQEIMQELQQRQLIMQQQQQQQPDQQQQPQQPLPPDGTPPPENQ